MIVAGLCRAEVLDVRGNISAEVNEFVAGENGSSDRSFEDFPQTIPTFPIEAIAGLGDFFGELGATSGSRGAALLDDPQSSETRNPAELGLEAEAFSVDQDVSYESIASAVESRTLRFSAQELGTSQPSQTLRSVVFLRGAALLWTSEQGRDLSGMSVEFDFKIIKDTGTNGGETVFEVGFEATGTNGAQVMINADESLNLISGTPSVLVQRFGDTAQDEADNLSRIGRVRLILLPPQELSYEYEAFVDEEFELRAESTVRVVNLPNGTGAGIALGRPFQSLGLAVTPFLDRISADGVQDVINDAITGAVPGGDNPDESPVQLPTILVQLCGIFGPEMMLAPLCMMAMRRRRLDCRSIRRHA